MTEELYINGELMDLDAGFKGVQMVFQSPYLTDLKSIVSNRTNTVTLPATQRNRTIIGYTSLQATGTFPYRKHRAIYKREGVQMFDGSATLLSVTDTQIQMCFTWGNVDAFQKLFDMRLRDLAAYNEREQYIQYNTPVSATQPYYAMLVDCGLGRKQPALPAYKIIDRIQAACGVTGLSTIDVWKPLGVLCTTRRGNATTRYAQRFYGRFNSGTLIQPIASSARYSCLLNIDTTDMRDVRNLFDSGTSQWNVESANIYWVRLNGTITIDVSNSIGNILDKKPHLTMSNASGGYTLIDAATINVTPTESTPQTGHRRYTYTFNNVQITRNVKYPYLSLSLLLASGAFQVYAVAGSDLTMELIQDPNLETDEVVWGASYDVAAYPMWFNLPDMSCGDFIKSLMLPFGLFAYCKTDNKIEFTSFAELFTNRTRALDWTDKMLTQYPKNRQTKIDGFAQRNLVKYKADEGVPQGALDSVITCDDENLEAEKTLYESLFTLPYNNKVPLWQKSEDGDIEFVGDERAPRLIGEAVDTEPEYVQNMGYQSRLAWQYVLETYYTEYQRVVNKPVVIKADFLITTADLNALDMRVPVYLKQTGRYYAIRKLTTKNAKVSEAELIELK